MRHGSGVHQWSGTALRLLAGLVVPGAVALRRAFAGLALAVLCSSALVNAANIDGTSRNDTLDGTTGADYLRGLDGNDNIRGLEGNDSVNGNAGDDFVNGNQGNDLVQGGQGNDTVHGGSGDDTLYGGWGDDYLYGGSENDTFVYRQGDGNDTVVDTNGRNKISFRNSADTAPLAGTMLSMGKSGNDLLISVSGGGQVTVKDYYLYTGNWTIDPAAIVAPVIEAAGVGGDALDCIWINGQNFASDCTVDIRPANYGAVIGTYRGSDRTLQYANGRWSITLRLKTDNEKRQMADPGVLVYVVNPSAGTWSDPMLVKGGGGGGGGTTPVIEAAGVGGDALDCIWINGQNFANDCYVDVRAATGDAIIGSYTGAQRELKYENSHWVVTIRLQSQYEKDQMAGAGVRVWIVNPSAGTWSNDKLVHGGGGGGGGGEEGLVAVLYHSRDQAAKVALAKNWDSSVKDQREYGGVIYRVPNTELYGFCIVVGKEHEINVTANYIPDAATVVAWWHTHPSAYKVGTSIPGVPTPWLVWVGAPGPSEGDRDAMRSLPNADYIYTAYRKYGDTVVVDSRNRPILSDGNKMYCDINKHAMKGQDADDYSYTVTISRWRLGQTTPNVFGSKKPESWYAGIDDGAQYVYVEETTGKMYDVTLNDLVVRANLGPVGIGYNFNSSFWSAYVGPVRIESNNGVMGQVYVGPRESGFLPIFKGAGVGGSVRFQQQVGVLFRQGYTLQFAATPPAEPRMEFYFGGGWGIPTGALGGFNITGGIQW